MSWPCLGYKWTEITSLDLPALDAHELRVWGAPGLPESSRTSPTRMSPTSTSSLPSRAAAVEETPWPG